MADFEKELARLLDRYAQGIITSDEKKILDRFFDESKLDALKDEVEPAQFKLLEQRLKKGIDQRISTPSSWRPVLYRVAATLTIIAVVAYLIVLQTDRPVVNEIPAMLTSMTKRGQKLTVRLPDGTIVRLNSRSKLVFPEKFASDTRQVALEGEGYFEVVHDPSSPFIVTTSHSTVQVLGTSFNINEKNERATEITLVSGKVEVSSSQGSSVRLKPNQQAVIRSVDAAIDTAHVDVSKFIEWKDDVLRFDGTPMTEVVDRLEDWYGAEIVIRDKALEGCRITARYDSESLENVLKSFEFMLKGKFTLHDGKATISGKGCNGND